MRFLSKLSLLAMVAYAAASPKIEHRAEGDSSGYDFSNFLGKIPEYFKTPEGVNEVSQPSSAESGANSGVQHDPPASTGAGAAYPGSEYVNQMTGGSNSYNDQIRNCMASFPQQIPSGSLPNYPGGGGSGGSGGSGSSSGGSSGGYGVEQYQQRFEECRKKVSEGFSNQNYENYMKPPAGFPNFPGSSSGSSAGAASASA